MEKKQLNSAMTRFCLPGLFALLLATGISSCSKTGAGCFSGTGSITTETRPVEDFDTIIANQNVDIILTQDSVNTLEVEAGSNLLAGITTEVVNRQLTIGNTNKCNWVRSYDTPLNVYVHAKNLRKIYYLSAGNITSTNTISVPTLMIDIWGGCGVISLSVNIGQGQFYEHLGTADLTVQGKAGSISVSSGEFGLVQLKDLESDLTYVSNTGSNDCYVNAVKYLDASIGNIGNIYYTGKPDTILTHVSGTGQLIHF
jgi:hypothetical protein